MQRALVLPPFMRDNSVWFSSCGTKFFWMCTCEVAAWEVLDQSVGRSYIDLVDLDLISEIWWSRFNLALGESWSETWLPVDTLMKIGRRKSRRSGPASWDRGPHIVQDVDASWPFNQSSMNWMARIFHDEIFYKSMFSLLKLNFWLKREEIKHFGGRS